MRKTDLKDYDNLKDLVLRTRSFRRFHEDYIITEEDILMLIELARLSGFGGNRQSFKFWAVLDEEKKEKVFETLKWAAYYKEWDGPKKSERPSAYIVIFHDKKISNTYYWEHGIAAQSILLGATAKDLGGCMIASFNHQEIVDILGAEDNLNPLMVIALGKPKEEVILDCVDSSGSVEYWRDSEDRHHVPKRTLKEILKVI